MENFEMKLSIKNIGKIESVDIKLDGITVICGENNTGKSTIGKVLFAYFNSMSDFESKIREQRLRAIKTCFIKYTLSTRYIFDFEGQIEQFLSSYVNPSLDDINNFFEQYRNLKNKKTLSEDIYSILNMPNEDLLSEYIFRYFIDVFNGQIRNENVNSKQQSFIKTIFKNGTNTINFLISKCKLNQEVPILHCAYYINNPFIADYLNVNSRWLKSVLSELDRNIIDTINSAQMEQSIDKMRDIFDAVANKDKLDEIRKLLHRAYTGRTIRKNGLYFYNDGKSNIEFRNLSTGLKSFALIERLLESGKLKSKDVLILDEPEIHLHPEWQLVYAEIIVLLQKEFDLTVLITTHSPYFLEAVDVYSKKYNREDILNYYLAENKPNEYSSIEEVTGKLNLIYEKMYYPLKRLEEEEI
ncbi:MAG: AAA family ATPase [Ruminococcus sp.]|nr:AAA family ATPase [Ruminococcus sp.]